MKELIGDIWQIPCHWICIPTNGEINKYGYGIMGKGVALQAKQRIPGIERELGYVLQAKGNVTAPLAIWRGKLILSFPTKTTWKEPSNSIILFGRALSA